MKYAVEMDSGAIIYTPSFIKIGLGIQKLIAGVTQTHRHTDRLESAQAYFRKVSLRDHLPVCASVCMSVHPPNLFFDFYVVRVVPKENW
jgi:hypothetical protein